MFFSLILTNNDNVLLLIFRVVTFQLMMMLNNINKLIDEFCFQIVYLHFISIEVNTRQQFHFFARFDIIT